MTSSVVSDLLKTKFCERDLAERRKIACFGPPQPELSDLLQPATVGTISFERRFDLTLYARFPWLTGCVTRSKLFCWPCLLYSSQQCKDNQAWVRDGVNDLRRLAKLARDHASTKSHMLTSLLLDRFIYHEIEGREVEVGRTAEAVKAHNRTVAEYRHLLTYHASLLSLLAYQASPLITESTAVSDGRVSAYLSAKFNTQVQCSRRVDFPATLPALASHLPKLYDEEPRLKNHSNNSSSPLYNLGQIQRDLCEVMSEIYREVIQRELDQVDYVSLHYFIGHTEPCKVNRVALFVNYVLINGTIYGRYLDSVNFEPSNGINAQLLNTLLSKALELYHGLGEKLTSVSLECLPISCDTFDQFHVKLKESFPKILLTPDSYYPSWVNLLRNLRVNLQRHLNQPRFVLEFVDDVRLLFRYIDANQHLLECEDHVMKDSLDCRRVRDHLEVYREFFQLEPIMKPMGSKEDDVLSDKERIFKFTTSFEFILLVHLVAHWFEVFETVEAIVLNEMLDMSDVVLFKVWQLIEQCTKLDSKTFDSKWNEAKSQFFAMKYKFGSACKLTQTTLDQAYPESKREPFREFFKQIAQLVKKHFDGTFEYLLGLRFFTLLSPRQTTLNPQTMMRLVDLEEQGFEFDSRRLHHELTTVYGEKFFNQHSPFGLYTFLTSNALEGRFREVTKLARLMLTVAPKLCGVEHDDIVRQVDTFQELCLLLDGKSSDQWNFVVLNRAISEQLHPKHAQLSESSCCDIEHSLDPFSAIWRMYNPQIKPEQVALFRDVTTELIVHRYSLHTGLDALIYQRSI